MYAVLNIAEYGDPRKFAALPQSVKAFVVASINEKLRAEKREATNARRKGRRL